VGRARRQRLLQPGEQRVAARPVRGAQLGHARVEVDRLQPARGRRLVDRRGVQVGRLLGDRERLAQRLRRPHPADPQPGRGDLRQRREREHAVVERGERRQRLAAVAQLAVRVVLQQPEAAGPRERDQRLAPLARQRAARRVLERRDRVEQPRAVPRRERVGGVRIQAVVVARHRHHRGAGELERLQRRKVRRLLDEHGVARLEQHGRDQRQRLLRAAGDQQLVGMRGQAAHAEPLGDRRAQRRIALGGRVLQRAADDVVAESGGERGARPVRVEQLRGGQAARERDHARALRERQDLPHRRGLQAAQPRGQRRRGSALDVHRESLAGAPGSCCRPQRATARRGGGSYL
jgi:hypothetical protein